MPVATIDEPIGAKFLSLDSPAFAAEYPPIRNKELIPAGLLGLLDSIWTTAVFASRPINFYRLRKVFVAFEGLVFDADLNVYGASITDHQPDEVEISRHLIRARMADGSLPVHLRPGVLCKKRGTYNYGHFLIEMLSKAFLAKRHLAGTGPTYIVGGEGGALGAVMRDALSMLDIAQTDVVPCDRAPVFFSELILIDGVTRHSRYMSPLVFDCIDRLTQLVGAEGSERIYVSRASAQYRKLLNEDELAPILASNGYSIIDPGVLSFTQQIAAFKAARSVIGVTGAGLTNIAFSRPGASVTFLTPASMPETFFWFLSTLKNHRFLEVRLQEQGGEPPGYPLAAGNIHIETEEFRRLIAN